MTQSKIKALQSCIAEAMEHAHGTTKMTKARRVLNSLTPHFEQLAIAAYTIGRETDDMFELERKLKEDGLLPKSCDLNSYFEKILARYE